MTCSDTPPKKEHSEVCCNVPSLLREFLYWPLTLWRRRFDHKHKSDPHGARLALAQSRGWSYSVEPSGATYRLTGNVAGHRWTLYPCVRVFPTNQHEMDDGGMLWQAGEFASTAIDWELVDVVSYQNLVRFLTDAALDPIDKPIASGPDQAEHLERINLLQRSVPATLDVADGIDSLVLLAPNRKPWITLSRGRVLRHIHTLLHGGHRVSIRAGRGWISIEIASSDPLPSTLAAVVRLGSALLTRGAVMAK